MRASEFRSRHPDMALPCVRVLRAKWALLTLIALSVVLSACVRQAPAPLPQDAYIWQRKWTPAVPSAMRASGNLVRTWHVLAAELDAPGNWTDIAPDWTALKSGRQVVMVLRIDGQLNDLQGPASIRHALTLLQRWRQAGVQVTGLEIDHDCATARLPAYAQFLTRLRQQLDNDISLSITALPTWLESPALDALLAASDEAVLQVHAVMNPRLGLFDAQRASAWLSAFGQRTDHPWRVALPSYGTRVAWDKNGRLTGIESEAPPMPTAAADDVSNELIARPEAMAAFVAELEQAPPHGLRGIVWFRLPTEDDARAWSLPTWRAVLARQPLLPNLQVLTQAATGAGGDTDNANATHPALRDIVLVNTGNADASLPLTVRLDRDCGSADGINGYALETDQQGMYLQRTRDGLLRAGRQRNIGWLLCRQKNNPLHVQS